MRCACCFSPWTRNPSFRIILPDTLPFRLIKIALIGHSSYQFQSFSFSLILVPLIEKRGTILPSWSEAAPPMRGDWCSTFTSYYAQVPFLLSDPCTTASKPSFYEHPPKARPPDMNRACSSTLRSIKYPWPPNLLKCCPCREISQLSVSHVHFLSFLHIALAVLLGFCPSVRNDPAQLFSHIPSPLFTQDSAWLLAVSCVEGVKNSSQFFFFLAIFLCKLSTPSSQTSTWRKILVMGSES